LAAASPAEDDQPSMPVERFGKCQARVGERAEILPHQGHCRIDVEAGVATLPNGQIGDQMLAVGLEVKNDFGGRCGELLVVMEVSPQIPDLYGMVACRLMNGAH